MPSDDDACSRGACRGCYHLDFLNEVRIDLVAEVAECLNIASRRKVRAVKQL
jgi:hypothetical protein